MNEIKNLIDEIIHDYFYGNIHISESQFKIYNHTLSPDLWDEYQHLDARTRVNLLRMAYDFYEKTKFIAPIVDVWLMGSIANYNWTPDSDVDVHIIIDFSQLKMPPETASKAAKSAGAQWNSEHEVTVKGHKVEINIQSVKAEKPYITGIYSLVRDQWIRKPHHYNVEIDKELIQSKYSELKKYIELTIRSGNREQMKVAKKYLDAFRQYGLDTSGELSEQNIIYKILRSRGIIKILKDAITATYDKEMTVTENDNQSVQDYIGTTYNGEVRATPVANAKSSVHNDHGMISGINSENWRYIAKSNTIMWNTLPSENDKDQVSLFLQKRGIINPKQKSMYSFAELPEVAEKDIKSRHPLPLFSQNLSQMTLNNLKAMREKSARFWKDATIKNDEEEIRQSKKDFQFYDKELKRRLKYINNPALEEARYAVSHKEVGRPTWRGPHVGHELNLMLKGKKPAAIVDGIEGAKNFLPYIKNGTFVADQTDWGAIIIALPQEQWRIKKIADLINTNDVRDLPRYHAKLGILLGYDKQDIRNFINQGNKVDEGYGAGNPEDDPLHIPGERWRIKWYNARKTPKMVDELIKELINKWLPEEN